jgi:hypothetical protein
MPNNEEPQRYINLYRGYTQDYLWYNGRWTCGSANLDSPSVVEVPSIHEEGEQEETMPEEYTWEDEIFLLQVRSNREDPWCDRYFWQTKTYDEWMGAVLDRGSVNTFYNTKTIRFLYNENVLYPAYYPRVRNILHLGLECNESGVRDYGWKKHANEIWMPIHDLFVGVNHSNMYNWFRQMKGDPHGPSRSEGVSQSE